MCYGPNTNNGSILTMIESQVEHILLHLHRMTDDDLAWVEVKSAVQAGYNAQGLSAYAGTPAPAPAPAVDWPAIDDGRVVSDFWPVANFLLPFAPPLPWEGELRESFGRLGLKDGTSWPPPGRCRCRPRP